VRLLFLLATTYVAAHSAISLLVTGRLEVSLEHAAVAAAVVLAEWSALGLARRVLGRRARP
jgi:hypothetical protein